MNELAGQSHRNRLACRAAWWKWHQTGFAARLIPVDISRRTGGAPPRRIPSPPYPPRCPVRSRTPPAIQLCSMCRATPRAIRSLAVTVTVLALVPLRARRGAAALPVFADAAAGGAALTAPGGAAAGFDTCGRLRVATGELWIRRAV